jgi:lipopolysaccharide biosynthesis regulator YciM
MLFCSVPGNKLLEQAIARCHRPGQEADEVEAEVYQHTEELVRAWHKALEDAEYVEKTTGQRQKILLATRVGI